MRCRFCGSEKLRTSRFRGTDLFRILLFEYPIRCRECDMRGYTTILQALHIRHFRKMHHKKREERAAKQD